MNQRGFKCSQCSKRVSFEEHYKVNEESLCYDCYQSYGNDDWKQYIEKTNDKTGLL